MALVKNPTKISLDSSLLPTGYTDPGGENLAGAQPTYQNLRINIDKSTVENAAKATTFDNILSDAVVGIEAQVANILSGDDIGSIATANYNIDWKQLRNNQPVVEQFYTDAAVEYVATVDVYVVIS